MYSICVIEPRSGSGWRKVTGRRGKGGTDDDETTVAVSTVLASDFDRRSTGRVEVGLRVAFCGGAPEGRRGGREGEGVDGEREMYFNVPDEAFEVLSL